MACRLGWFVALVLAAAACKHEASLGGGDADADSDADADADAGLCDLPLTDCAGQCVRLQTDPRNCGACGLACALRAACSDGQCECPRGMSVCDGVCVDPRTYAETCGSCADDCGFGETCIDRQCVCIGGRERCEGACVYLDTDERHCGACGSECGEGTCVDGQCECSPPRTVCSGVCVDLRHDVNHCGACEVSCAATGSCIDGQCADHPAIAYEFGSCDALLDPAALDDPEVIAATGALIESLDPFRLSPDDFMVTAEATAGVANCAAMSVGNDVDIAAGEGCGSGGRWWWGSLSHFLPTKNGSDGYRLTAEGFSQVLPEDFGVTLLQLEGVGRTAPRNRFVGASGHSSIYVHVERVDERPSGEWYLDWAADDRAVSGYLRHIDGEWGPGGDLCFEGSLSAGANPNYQHLHLTGAGTGTATQMEDGSWQGALGLCDPGLTPCGDDCPDIATDRAHCGACDIACDDDEECSDGSCVRI